MFLFLSVSARSLVYSLGGCTTSPSELPRFDVLSCDVSLQPVAVHDISAADMGAQHTVYIFWNMLSVHLCAELKTV